MVNPKDTAKEHMTHLDDTVIHALWKYPEEISSVHGQNVRTLYLFSQRIFIYSLRILDICSGCFDHIHHLSLPGE